MKRLAVLMMVMVSLFLLASGSAAAADDAKVKAATQQVESGAKKIPDVTETAKGVGDTAVEGAKYSGEKVKEAAQATEPPARSAWDNTRDGVIGAGRSVKTFFTSLFSK